MSEPDFDPDAYLRDLRARKAAEAPFDPDAYLRDLKEKKAAQAQYGLSAVGAVRLGETPEAAAKRLGGHFITSAQSAAALGEVNRNVMREGLAKPIMSAAQGALSNFGDELAAGTETAKGIARHPINTLGKWGATYDLNHADWQRMFDQSTQDNPAAYLGGALMAPNPVGKAGLLARLLAMGGQGAMAGLGGSKASLVNGEFGEAAKDTGVGGAIGLAAGAGAELIGAPVRWLAGKLGTEATAAADAVRVAKQEAADKVVKSETGVLGNIGTSEANAMNHARDVVENPHFYDQPTYMAALNLVNSAEGKAFFSRSAGNMIAKARGLFANETVQRQVLADATSAAQAPAIDAATSQTLNGAPSDFLKKLWNSVGQRAVLGAAGAGVGRLTDEVTGGDGKGTFTGGLLGAMAAPGALQFMRNSAKNPAFQHAALTGVSSLLGRGAGAVDSTARLAGQTATSDSPVDSPFLRWLNDEATPEETSRAMAAALRQKR